MEISAIMNIHELAVNRTVRQISEAQVKNEQEAARANAQKPAPFDMKNKGVMGAITNPVQLKTETKQDERSETSVTGNIVDIRT